MRDIERSRMCEERGRVREGDGKGRVIKGLEVDIKVGERAS